MSRQLQILGFLGFIGVPKIHGGVKSDLKGFSLRYASPELFFIMDHDDYNVTMADTVVDVYAFSVVLWEMLDGILVEWP